jgi:hypothetical protein
MPLILDSRERIHAGERRILTRIKHVCEDIRRRLRNNLCASKPSTVNLRHPTTDSGLATWTNLALAGATLSAPMRQHQQQNNQHIRIARLRLLFRSLLQIYPQKMSCPDCFRGHDHHGPISGTETVMHGLNTYVTSPPEDSDTQSGNVIVIFSDAFGWGTVNLRKLADTYARRTGCRVYLPDFMYGQ